MERVTRGMLQRKVDILNGLLGTPAQSSFSVEVTHSEYSKDVRVSTPCTANHIAPGGNCLNCGWYPGRKMTKYNRGNIHLDRHQPGGNKRIWKLETNGGHDIPCSYRMTAQEMAFTLDGLIWGVEHAQERGQYAHEVEQGRAVQTAIRAAMEGN